LLLRIYPLQFGLWVTAKYMHMHVYILKCSLLALIGYLKYVLMLRMVNDGYR